MEKRRINQFALGVVAGLALVAMLAFMGNRDRDQLNEIARQKQRIQSIATVCPEEQLGHELIATIRDSLDDKPGPLRCIYSAKNYYAHATHERLAPND